jgi:sporadic carbohydrate cluster 2OG-Fe(II) oxygenase
MNKQQFFINNGYISTKLLSNKFLETASNIIKAIAQVEDLSLLHKSISQNDVNTLRIDCYNKINSLPEIREILFNDIKDDLLALLGNDIVAQNRINISIQMPGDSTSQLNLHTDTISGQSEYEVVSWIPLTRAFSTNSIYIIPKELSYSIYSNLNLEETIGNTRLFEKFKNYSKFIDLSPPSVLIFSSTLFHGNVTNTTESTRVSINFRFKPTFSPSQYPIANERKLGTFYTPMCLSPISRLILDYKEPGDFK